ncbi:MAG: magnesium/cobalt transporter CorA [Thalassobaculales bacterium]
MLTIHQPEGNRLACRPEVGGGATLSEATLPEGTLWLDLLDPTPEEAEFVVRCLGLRVPSRAEQQEIEITSRLFEEGEALYMTATVLFQAESDTPQLDPVTFILCGQRLVSLRYVDPHPFRVFPAFAERHPWICADALSVLLGLVDAIISRLADVLEHVGASVDQIANAVFTDDHRPSAKDLDQAIQGVGRAGGRLSKIRESLLSIDRMLSFLAQSGALADRKGQRKRLQQIGRDVQSLSDHATFLANKVNFLLDATLGMINIQQNGIIKIFSVAAVVFLPPTLVASIYGMNFEVMPELQWEYGYPMALGLMVLSAILPYIWFKRKGWL